MNYVKRIAKRILAKGFDVVKKQPSKKRKKNVDIAAIKDMLIDLLGQIEYVQEEIKVLKEIRNSE